MSDWTILCDFDGTVSVEDTTDTLLERFGRDGWQALEEQWRAGRIGSHDCMAGQVALLDMDRAELDAHLDTRHVDAAFAGFVRLAQAHGLHLEILSDGLDYAIHRILGRHGLDWLPVTANALQAVAAREWRPDDLGQRMLAANREMRVAKFATDKNNDLVLCAELPTESLDYSELADAVARMEQYARLFHDELMQKTK